MAGERSGPSIYEIPTRVWLESLRASGAVRAVTLADVPDAEWDRIASYGFDLVWLMGVWERSEEGREIARAHPGLRISYRQALPDLVTDDIVGSPYAIRRYVVDPALGGDVGLARARAALERRGVGLILDFVPNHVARDHAWVSERPDLIVRGGERDLVEHPDNWFHAGSAVIAHGRDPYFAGWSDTAQLDVFARDATEEAGRLLTSIAAVCDGVRCDMAMLVTREIFARTWGRHVGSPPPNEYWCEVLEAVRSRHPSFLAIAEAYWNTEDLLQVQGFDYVYDKTLYDHLVASDPEAIRDHLAAVGENLWHRVHFTENHDEPRAAATWSKARCHAANVIVCTIPGARLLYDGQIEGARIRVPVQLRRRVAEPVDPDSAAFYRRLLEEIREGPYRDGVWRLLSPVGWPGDDSARRLLAWCWDGGPDHRRVVVVNLTDEISRGRVVLPWPDLSPGAWRLRDRFGETYVREGSELLEPGLFVELLPDAFHVLAVERA